MRLIVFAFAALTIAGIGTYCIAETRKTEAEWAEIETRKAELEQMFVQLNLFRDETGQTFAEIWEEDLPLAKAIDQVEEASRKHYPTFLKFLAYANKGATLKEAIAENIIGFFANETHRGKESARRKQVVERLRNERAVLFAKGSMCGNK